MFLNTPARIQCSACCRAGVQILGGSVTLSVFIGREAALHACLWRQSRRESWHSTRQTTRLVTADKQGAVAVQMAASVSILRIHWAVNYFACSSQPSAATASPIASAVGGLPNEGRPAGGRLGDGRGAGHAGGRHRLRGGASAGHLSGGVGGLQAGRRAYVASAMQLPAG